MPVWLDSKALPILDSRDVVIIDASLAGIAAALALARAGHDVAIVEPRTYPGREITATLNHWIRPPQGMALPALPELIRTCIEAGGTTTLNGEYPLHPDAVKRRLEDLLLAADVRMIYASLPVGLCFDGDSLAGVAIGNKSGRQVIACQILIDTSPSALVCRLAGASFSDEPQRLIPGRVTLEFDHVGSLDEDVLAVPSALGVVGNVLHVHRGYRGPLHVLVEAAVLLSYPVTDAFEMTRRDIEARRKAIDIAFYLVENIPAFEHAELATTSYESAGLLSNRLASPPPAWVEPLTSAAIGGVQATLSAFAGPVRGIWCLGDAARLDDTARLSLCDPIMAAQTGEAFGQAIADAWPMPASLTTLTMQPQRSCGQVHESYPRPAVREPNQPQRGRTYTWHTVPAMPVPLAYDGDVLVAGGGTSGAMAAIAAAREGISTCIVDMNPGLGGTGTYGGTHSYWFGRRTGFCAQSLAVVNDVHQRLHLPPAEGPIPTWNIEAKVYALTDATDRAGAKILLNALLIGALVEGTTVQGVVAATRFGPVALRGKITIDATGDGDIAAFAGARYVYGSRRDHAVMWYTLHQFARPGRTRNNFTSTVDVSNIEDYNRAILAGRRRGDLSHDHDHAIYLATRESRHVLGDVVLTITDQLLRRAWPDVINIAFSNNDIKGQATSDWLRMGLIPPNLESEIPYRALLPQGLDNILVVGKAISCTHDALPAIRMQPDLENLGGVAGLAAAEAVRTGRSTRSLDVPRLQAALVKAGVLPQSILGRRLAPLPANKEHIEVLISQLTGEQPLYAYSDMEINAVYTGRIPLVDICCAGAWAIPLLEQALMQAEGARKVLLAQALAMMESPAGVEVLVQTIMAQLASGRLPERRASIRHANRYAPDQAAMPDTAYLLHSLGMARDRRALPVWQRVVDLMAPVDASDVCDQAKGLFHYVDAVCCGAERLGDPAAIPILEQLHRYAPFHNQQCLDGFEPDYLKERLAYLEIVICRALARCGGREGIVGLISYIKDVRAVLADHAYDELVAISGQDIERDTDRWYAWLSGAGTTLVPRPWTAPTDAVAAWGEDVLVWQESPHNDR